MEGVVVWLRIGKAVEESPCPLYPAKQTIFRAGAKVR